MMAAQHILERFDDLHASNTGCMPSLGDDSPPLAINVPADLLAASESAPLQDDEALEADHETAIAALREAADSLQLLAEQHFAKFCAALGDAIAEALPSVLDAGYAAEAANVMLEVATQCEISEPTILVADADHDQIVDWLESATPSVRVRVEQDPACPAGTIRVRWPDGGAEIVKDRLVEAVKADLANRLRGAERSDPTHG